MDFEATVLDTFDQHEKILPRRLNELFSHFLKDERAVLDLYKIWLLGDLRVDEHHSDISRKIEARDEDDILADILKHCSPKTREYYMDGLNQKDERKLIELEDLFGQFGLMALTGAGFAEIAPEEENTGETV